MTRHAILIAGPTASGKSTLALSLAQKVHGEIINADSMQVYRDLRILSARPTQAEEMALPHHLFGFVDAEQEYSVGQFLRDLLPVLADCRARDKTPILVGGTGLYFMAMTQGLADIPPVPVAIKQEIDGWKLEGPALHAVLQSRDPKMAARLELADTQRIERALGVYMATGLSLSDWWDRGTATALLPPGTWRGVMLDPGRDRLNATIDSRFIAMIAEGALDEVRALAIRKLPRNRGIMKAHGVPHLVQHIDGLLPLDDAIRRGQADTRRYAKRQRTFYRHKLTGFGSVDQLLQEILTT